jgi:hypothetical protein
MVGEANYNYNVYIYNKLSLSMHACKIQLCKLYMVPIYLQLASCLHLHKDIRIT